MEQRTTYGYIYLGTIVRYLLDTRPGAAIFADATILENIANLDYLLGEYEFHVTRRVSYEIFELQNKWAAEKELDESGELASTRTITEAETAYLTAAARITRETLLAEASGKISFIASDKRYTVDKLMNDVGSLMGGGVYESLPDIAKYDFEEGGKAIAFDLPTAAAFHILRGTEAVLRDFYCRVVRRERIPEPRMWAAMVKGMRNRRNAPSSLLLDNLDSLRSNFRNPTQHPEKSYDLDEVQDLLALSVDSINRMIRHLADKSL